MSRHHLTLNRRRWDEVRRKVLDRDRWRCRQCGRYGNEVDHIEPLHRGGARWDEGNLQTLCRSCHIAKTAGENGRELIPEEVAWRELVAELTRGTYCAAKRPSWPF